MTANPLRGMNRSGSTARTSTPEASTPASSAASRSAAGTGPAVGLVDRAAGERGLAGVTPQPGAALHQQQVGAVRARAEEHQHR